MSKDKYFKAMPSLNGRLHFFDEIDSTNTYAKKLANQGELNSVVIAGAQSSGRGRLGRSFVSPSGSGLYLSMVLPPQNQWPIHPTILVGSCVSSAIEEVIGSHICVKWVNDIILDFFKVGGILAESIPSAVIIGIGVNINTPQSYFKDELSHVSSLGTIKNTQYPVELIGAAIIKKIDALTLELKNTEYIKSCLDNYRSRLITLGMEVKVSDTKGERFGKALELLDDGSLLVRFDDTDEKIFYGDVSVRGIDRYI